MLTLYLADHEVPGEAQPARGPVVLCPGGSGALVPGNGRISKIASSLRWLRPVGSPLARLPVQIDRMLDLVGQREDRWDALIVIRSRFGALGSSVGVGVLIPTHTNCLRTS